MNDKDKHTDINALLNGVFENHVNHTTPFSLDELFDQRLQFLGVTKNQAVKILDVETKTLDSLLSGESKKIDFLTILKLSQFLEIPHTQIVDKYFNLISTTHKADLSVSKKRSFIVNNFNLPALKKIGFIDTITDFDHIEKRILTFFGYKDIYEYSKYKITPAYSSAKRQSNKDNLTFWIAAACESIKTTPNHFEYNRQALVDYFPTIRWHSMNVENGLLIVAQTLFKLGVTLVYVPKFTSDLHVRGATLSINDKPCIALTKYTQFYPSMWFALIHELYHVLFDWDKIKENDYHISGEMDTMNVNEEEANSFARQYLFSDEKMDMVKPHINNRAFVEDFAQQNHIHPSFIYVFNAYDSSGDDNKYKRLASRLPKFDGLLERLRAHEWENFTPIKQIAKNRTSEFLK